MSAVSSPRGSPDSCLASGLAWYALLVGLHPDYVARWLPATIITGLGIGLTFPVLSAAAVSSLHIERFAVGSAVNQTARQVGGALGIATLATVVRSGSVGAAATFEHVYLFCALAVLGTAAVGLGLILRPAPGVVTAAAAELTPA